MEQARIFEKSGACSIVTADDVLKGKVSSDNEFIDLEYEFKVTFVRASRNHGSPYFRLYMSRDDYKALTPNQKSRYDILAQKRHYQETSWHRGWKELVSSFCTTEKTIHEKDSNKYKIADAFYEAGNLCVEFQHSFISFDFEERNEFYEKLGINVIWLYDLTQSTVQKNSDGYYEILEDNARGFFKIAEKEENLQKWPVFVQTKDRTIYRINNLGRKAIDSELKSTIRLFSPAGIYSQSQFIDNIKKCDREFLHLWEKSDEIADLHYISELWDSSFSYMVIQDMSKTENNLYFINRNRKGAMFRDPLWGNIRFKYVSLNGEKIKFRSFNDYSLKLSDEKEKKYKLILSSKRMNADD
jgi:hypothetical protein